MALHVQVYPMTSAIQNTDAGRFLQEALSDMFLRGFSSSLEMQDILYFTDGFLLFCTDELSNPCGVFATCTIDWDEELECWVNIAYTHPRRRRQGVFKTLLDYTVNTLPEVVGNQYDVISFGVFNHNTIMQTVMGRCGCLPVRPVFSGEAATVFSLMHNKGIPECTHC